MSLEHITHAGLAAVRLTNNSLEVIVAVGVGPRVISLSANDRPNVFAELDETGLDLPDGGRFTFHGGHRLWVAPEEPDRTYEPDDSPVNLIQVPNGLIATQPASVGIGIEKAMEIVLGTETTATVSHRLTNRSDAALSLAPWAITQLVTGGTGILPYGTPSAAGPQASSILIGWPYTDFSDPGLLVGPDLIYINAMRSSATKIGSDLRRGWIAYVIGDQVFVKRARQQPGSSYADRGASAQIYCDDRFIELETLGPLVTLNPGETTSHVETWSLHQLDGLVNPHAVPSLLDLDT